MEKTRELVDNLESNVPKEYWPIPTYEDILISKKIKCRKKYKSI